ncbi:Fic family protein [Fibrobacter sp.]|uniref:Fic family protein n=1 Tax=Fibrobacter sp. TaxID=35828 RepID=UPI0038660411
MQDKLHSDNPNIMKLIGVIGEQSLSVKEMMAAIELKDRENFLNLYLSPAINEGFVKMLYPNSPRHPRQKYLLTAKGVAAYQE